MNAFNTCYSCPLDPKPHRETMWCGLAKLGKLLHDLGIHNADDLRKRLED